MIQREYQATNINSGTSTQVFSGKGILQAVTINTTAAGTITIIDGVGSAASPVVAVLKSSVVEGTYLYNCAISTGLKVVTAAASDITVTWQK